MESPGYGLPHLWGWMDEGVLGASGMVWVKAGLVLAVPSLLSAHAAGKCMIVQKGASLCVPEKLLCSWEGDGAGLEAGLCPAVLSHPWTLLCPRPFLGKTSKSPAKGEWKTVSKSSSQCTSFCLGQVAVCKG